MRKSLTKTELLTALRRIRDELSKATLDNCETQAWNAFNIAADAIYLSTGECPASAPARSATTERRLRIRRCDGNKAAWMLVRLNRDGSESDCYGSYTTALSLDSLLKYAKNLTPRQGERIELIG